jgi:hypothetical protein
MQPRQPLAQLEGLRVAVPGGPGELPPDGLGRQGREAEGALVGAEAQLEKAPAPPLQGLRADERDRRRQAPGRGR